VIAALALAALLYAPPQLDATPASGCDPAAVAACAPADRPVVTPWPAGADNPPDPLYPVDPLTQGDDYPRPADVPGAPAVSAIALVPTVPAAVRPVQARRLAHTGVPTVPYLAVSVLLVGGGVLLRRLSRRVVGVTCTTATPLTTTPRSAD
jgi:hypothetical protein